MLLSTTDSLEGYRIERYLGIVGGEGNNMKWGGAKSVRPVIADAVEELRQVAHNAGANAVVGISIEHEVGQNGRHVVAYGTAVSIVPTDDSLPMP